MTKKSWLEILFLCGMLISCCAWKQNPVWQLTLALEALFPKPPEKQTRTKYLIIFCTGCHVLSQLCGKALYRFKGLHIKPNDLIGKTGLNSLGYYVNSTLEKKIYLAIKAHRTISMYQGLDTLLHILKFTVLHILKFWDKNCIFKVIGYNIKIWRTLWGEKIEVA